MDFREWLLEPVLNQLDRIEGAIIAMTASIDQVRADYKSYANELKQQRDDAIALAEQYAATAQENADALAAFQADDEATDAAQLAQKEADDAAAFQSDLDELKAADEPTEPDPHPDQTLPGDLPE
jgi:DNA-directed RNA polymerase delta subunit